MLDPTAAPVATVGPSSPVLPPNPTVTEAVIMEYIMRPRFTIDFLRAIAYKVLGIP